MSLGVIDLMAYFRFDLTFKYFLKQTKIP
jgi:hypothetical protein